jgi:hypothetical protein
MGNRRQLFLKTRVKEAVSKLKKPQRTQFRSSATIFLHRSSADLQNKCYAGLVKNF